MSWDGTTQRHFSLYSLLLSFLSNERLVDVGDDTWNKILCEYKNKKTQQNHFIVTLQRVSLQLTTAGDCRFDERIKLLISSDGELQMTWGDTLHLEIFRSITRQLQHLKQNACMLTSGHCMCAVWLCVGCGVCVGVYGGATSAVRYSRMAAL